MRVLILATMALLAGCASAAREPDAAPPPASATAATAADASDENAIPTGAPAGEPAFKPPAGWRAKIVDWEIMYCRKGPVGGSHMVTELCMTEEQLKQHVAANDEMRRDLDRSTRVCARDGCTK